MNRRTFLKIAGITPAAFTGRTNLLSANRVLIENHVGQIAPPHEKRPVLVTGSWNRYRPGPDWSNLPASRN